MGETRVHVRLNNAMDVGMVRRGLLQTERIRSVEIEAVVDTDAVRSCIPARVKEELGLETARHFNAQMANGETQKVELTEAVYIDIMGRLATDSLVVLGEEVLIGRTVLDSTDLHVDPQRGRVITNPDHPNSAVIRIR